MKTRAGKTLLANTIIGEKLLDVHHFAGTSKRKAETKSLNQRRVILFDTPSFFDTNRPEEDMKREIVRCITECAPGPHVFLIVLKVDKYTIQEKAIVEKMIGYFSEDALRFTVVVFSHGDQLPEETTIEDFVRKS